VAAGPFANFLLAIILFSVIYVAGVPQLPARLQAPPEQSVAAKLGVMAGDQVVGWQSLSTDYSGAPILEKFAPVPSWNALRWLLLDALTGELGFALEIQDASGGRLTKSFKQADLPKIAPDSDPLRALGLLPQVTPPSEWQELQLGPIDALGFASERVYLITKVSFRLMLGLFTGEASLKQLGGPLSIADMAGKSAQVGWQPFVAFLALMSISIGLLNLVPLPMLDGGQLLYDAWELLAGKRISSSMQEKLQKVGFVLLISLSLLALFNDLQRYLSP
jgi:regulator of sigma E protease